MNTIMEKLSRIVNKHWKSILIISLIITIFSIYLSELLFREVKFSWTDLVPKDIKTIQKYKEILNDFKSANPIIVTVKGKNSSHIENAIKTIAPAIEKETKWFRTVMYKNDITFMSKYRFLLTKTKDLNNTKKFMTDFNLVPFIKGINDNLESEYVGNTENMKKKEKDASAFLSALHDFIKLINTTTIKQPKNETIKRVSKLFTTGPEYLISQDKKMGIITILPSISMDDLDNTILMVNHLDKIFRKYEKKLPGIKFGQTGLHTLTRDEMVTVSEDSGTVTLIAFILIIILLIYAFRMKGAPILGMITLISGIIAALGLTYIFIGSLNLLTAMIGAILMGLGIDYSVHILAQYTESRSEGNSPKQAVADAFINCGRGLFIGAVTTSVAFFILILIPFKAIAELGAVTAIGIVCCMIASFLLLPSLLIFKEYVITRKKNIHVVNAKNIQAKSRMQYHFISNIEKRINKYPIIIISVILLLTIFFMLNAFKMKFSGDLKEIEAKGLESIKLNDEILQHYDMSSDSIMVVSKTLKNDRKFYKQFDKNPMISIVESISAYLPDIKTQKKRLKIIKDIKKKLLQFKLSNKIDKKLLLKELDRLRMNMLEMRDLSYASGLDRIYKRCSKFIGKYSKNKKTNYMNSVLSNVKKMQSVKKMLLLQKSFAVDMLSKTLKMSSPDILTINKIPEKIKKRLISTDGKKFLLTAYLMKNNWKDISDNNLLKNIIKTTKEEATGTILFMKILIDTASREGKNATILSLAMIFILIMLDFKNFRAGIFSFLNLIVSTIWMLGIMHLIGQNLNFVNVLALPIIIGIGIDDSVHIMHRYKQLGMNSLTKVLKSTGRAIFLTSITTMSGFGSLYFANYQGLQSFGLFLFTGVAIALIMSTIFLPALIRLHPNIFNSKKEKIK